MRSMTAYRVLFLGISTFGLVSRFLLSGLDAVSYFTVLSNLLVWVWWVLAIVYTSMGQQPLFYQAPFKGAITLSIAATGIVYQTLLRGQIDDPDLIQQITLQINHGITPAAFIIDWCFFTPKERISAELFYGWLVFPGIYLLISLMYGAGSDRFLYYFLDFRRLPLPVFLGFLLGMILFFTIVGRLLLLWHNRRCPLPDNAPQAESVPGHQKESADTGALRPNMNPDRQPREDNR